MRTSEHDRPIFMPAKRFRCYVFYRTNHRRPLSHASHTFAVLAPLPRPAPVLSRPHPANCPECVCEIAIASGIPGEEDPANLYRIVGAVNPQLPERGLLKWNRPCKVRHCLTLHQRRNRILSLPGFYLGNFVYHKNQKNDTQQHLVYHR